MGKHEGEMAQIIERSKLNSKRAPIPVLKPIIALNADRVIRLNESAGALGRRVGGTQALLDEALEQGRTMTTQPGKKFQVVYWDGIDGFVSAFTPDGVQVGYGHVQWDPDPRHRETQQQFMTYHNAYIVANGFTGQGFGIGMMRLLEDYVAVNNTGIGAGYMAEIQAETPESQIAARRMLDTMGYVTSESGQGNFLRIVFKPQVYNTLQHKGPPLAKSTVRNIDAHTVMYPSRRTSR